METLFALKPIWPQGFNYFDNFLTATEEAKLIHEIANIELHAFSFQGYEAKRKVASFGYDYNFDKRSLTKGKSIPHCFDALIRKVGKTLGVDETDFGELLVTEYPIGSVINWHRDAFPFDLIAGVSLGADCTFRLRPHDKAKQGRSSVISFPVRQRSLYVIQGPARIEWQHSIAPVTSVRYSITLRTLKQK